MEQPHEHQQTGKKPESVYTPRLKAVHFLGGFLGWFVIASIISSIPGFSGIHPFMLFFMYLVLACSSLTILLTVGLTIYFFVKHRWIAIGIVTAVAVNVLVSLVFILSEQDFYLVVFRLAIPFFLFLP
jgi:hypothetical protein